MDDIVGRLRDNDRKMDVGLCDEAADEIERLTNEINGYKHDTRRLLEGEDHLHAEIGRLRADKAAISQTASDYLHEIEGLREGIEDTINTLEAMDLHIGNPLYERLCATMG